MKTEEDYFNLISDYSEGLLDENGRKDFERQLQADQKLMKHYEKYQEAQKLLELQAGQFIKQKLKALTPEAKQSKVIPISRYIVGVAAVVILLVLFIGWGGMRNQYSNESLLEVYAEAYPADPVRGEQTQRQIWENASLAYTNEEYQEAIRLFSAVQPDNARFIEAQFLVGNAAVMRGEYDLAISALEKVLAAEDKRFAKPAEWYLVLAHLGKGDEVRSREIAKKIFDGKNHPYNAVAGDFIKDLDSFWR
jgi:tetratricopeptide (TPR) repeat protein